MVAPAAPVVPAAPAIAALTAATAGVAVDRGANDRKTEMIQASKNA